MSPGILPFVRHFGSVENPSRGVLLFLDRLSVPGPLLALEMAPQFLSETSRGRQPAPRRGLRLTERFFDRLLPVGW
jgi:hypothetical protein